MNDMLNEMPVNEFTLRDVLYVLFRNKMKIIAFFIVVSAVVVSYVLITPDEYESQASLLIKEGRETLNFIPTTDTNLAVTTSRSMAQEISNEIEILRSPDVFSELVDTIGLEELLGDNSFILDDLSDQEIMYLHEDMVMSLMADVNVDQRRNTNIIGIAYQAPDPQLAHDVVANLIDIFMDRHIDVHYSEGSYDFYLSQAEESKEELELVEEELSELQSHLNVGSIDEYRSMLLKRIETLQQEYDSNAALIAETGTGIQMRQQMLNDLPETIITESFTGNESTLRELYNLQLNEQDLLSKYSENSVQVKEIRRQIAEAKKLLSDESQVNRGINTIYQDIQQELFNDQAKYASLLARSDEIEKVLAEAKEELNNLNTVNVKAQQLERQRQIYLDSYMKYSQSLEESRIDQIVQRQKLSNIRINQSATYPKRPLQSRKIRNLALGLVVGLFGGIGLAFVSEFLDHTMRRQEDIEKWLQLRTLVVIPDHSQDMVLVRNK